MNKHILILILGLGIVTNINAQWQPTSGPFGGRALSLTVSGTNIFAATGYNGVFLSTDFGENWREVNQGLKFLYVFTLATRGQNILAGTNGGVYRSSDNGLNWTALVNNLSSNLVRSLTVNGTNIYAITDAGIFLSTDDGTSWTDINSDLNTTDLRAMVAVGNSIFVGTGDKGVCKSVNNGTSWTQVNNGLFDLNIWSMCITGTSIFAGTAFDGVFLSTDYGVSWTQVNNNLSAKTIVSLGASDNSIFAGTDNGLFRSTDNGSSWISSNDGITAISSVKSFATVGTTILAGTLSEGIFKSTNNGNNWTSSNNGLSGHRIGSLAVSGKNIFAGSYLGLFCSKDEGNSWIPIKKLANRDITDIAASDSNIYVATGDGMFSSSDGGDTWNEINKGLEGFSYVLSVVLKGTNIFVGTISDGVFLSTDKGNTWKQKNNGLLFTQIYTLDKIGNNIIAGTTNGGVGKVFITENNGDSWTEIDNLMGKDAVSFAEIGSNVFAGTWLRGAFYSLNSGKNWVAVNNGIPKAGFISSIAPYGNTVYASSGASLPYMMVGQIWPSIVYQSSNNGTTWTNYNTGFGDIEIWAMSVIGNKIFAGTSKGVWKRTLPDLTLSVTPSEINAVAFAGKVSSVTLISNCVWKASVDQPWLKVSPTESIGNGSLNLNTTSDNLDTVPRTARITVSGEGALPQTITVTQATLYVLKPKITQKWNDVLICDNNNNLFTKYQWFKNDIAIKDAIQQYYYQRGGLSGRFYVEAFNNIEERGFSNLIDLANLQANKSFNIYPNPSIVFNKLTIQLSLPDEELSRFRIAVYSVKGEMINIIENIQDGMTIQFSDPGTYIVQLQSTKGEVKETKKVIVNR